MASTIWIDASMVNWLVAEAARRGIGYETLVNLLLREAMSRRSDGDMDLRQEIRQLIRRELQRTS